ncbi:helix-turn-helix domain-containing protein [Virgibacillus sp. C22-A2]|uniref:Helix-turn-helix domain-containing protein n=1 Tax=Virgibacillus tibetensis TaxID=3042313 RepID=A0ABU6KEF9_9BACI|nr:helix-turn-helix domain-containing protein [Virgibacillus sp. C22-A2]
MVKQLKKIFPSFIFFQDYKQVTATEYQWFITADNQIIGIDNSELTQKDTSILTTFLSPYNINIPLPTAEEQLWRKRIESTKTISHHELGTTVYRFVYFSIQKNQIEPKLFKEAIYAFFTKAVPIIWENEHEGMIIEEKNAHAGEDLSYEQIIDVLMSDLYVKINFLVGPYFENLNNIKKHYLSLARSAELAFTYSDKAVVTYIDTIPFKLVEQADNEFKNEITSIALKEFASDEDMLHTIKTFLQCNLNVSVTAKELYMHRNSLQYRLDKFNERTNIDIRQFHQALTVYLALLANMHKD